MPIPADILAVERPVNTVVIAYGKNKDHYAVRKRIGCKYVNGRNLPVNGPTIGHIVNGKFIPVESIDVSVSQTDLKDWGNIVFCDSCFRDILRSSATAR